MNPLPTRGFATAPTIQVSWGELIDKITILEIKQRQLKSEVAAANVRRELTALASIAERILLQQPNVASLKEQLKSVNEAL
jgi:hypothetical protein